MALDFIASFLSSSQFSITSLNLGPVFIDGVGVLGVSIKLDSKLFRNQREDGSYIVDGRILLPTTIDVEFVVQNQSAFDSIDQMLKDRSTIYTIKSRGLIFNNMVCTTEQIAQSPDNISSSPVHLVFREILLQNDAVPKTRQAADSTAIDRGISYLKDTTKQVTDLAGEVFNKFMGLF